MPDLTSIISTLRAGRYKYSLYLSYLPQSIVLSCSANGSPNYSTTGSILSVTVDTVTVGSVAAALSGYTVEVQTSAGVHKGWLRVAHGGGSGSTIPLSEHSAGTVQIVDNDLIIVRADRRIWDKLVLNAANLNKDSRIAYTDQNADPAPITNSGGPVVGFVSGSALTVNFYGSTSRTTDPDSGGSGTHSWTFPGATPNSSTDADPTGIAFPAGAAVFASHTFTDSGNSKSTTQWIPVFAHDTSSNAPVQLSACRLSYSEDEGWSAEYQIAQDSKAAAALIPDGSFVVIWAVQNYSGTEVSYGSNVANRSHILFVGYNDRSQIRIVPETSEVTFTAISPLGVLAKTPALPQLTIQKASPTKWRHLRSNSVFRSLIYLWRWHNSSFDLFDYIYPSSGDLSYTRLAAPVVSDQLAQYRDIAGSMGLLVTCDRIGRLITQTDPQLLNTSDRSARTTVLNMTTADIIELEYEIPYHWASKTVVGEGITDGSTASANKAIFSRAPGTAPASRGTNVETLGKQIVDNQADMNRRTGLHFARVNGLYNGRVVPMGARMVLPDGYAVIDPAYQDFFTLTLGATTNPRGIAFDNTTRWLAKSADIGFDPDSGAVDVSYTVDHETFGPDGRTEIRKQKAENGLPNLPSIDIEWPGWELPIIQIGDGLGYGPNTIAAWATDGYVYITHDFNTPFEAGGPTWVRTQLSTLGMSGTFQDFCEDAFSPAGTKNGWLVTSTKIYRVTDVFSTGSGIALTEQHSFTNTANLGRRSIDSSFGIPGKVAVMSYFTVTSAAGGTQWTYTTDGTNWTNVQIGTVAPTNIPVTVPTPWPGLHISSQVSGLCYAYATVGVTRGLYKSLDWGATWAVVSPAIVWTGTLGHHATLHVPFHDNPGDRLLWVSGRDGGANNFADLNLFAAEVGVTGDTSIQPGTGGPGIYRRSLTTLGNNRQWGAFIERLDGGGEQRNLWVTTSGGRTAADWTNVNSIEGGVQGWAWDSAALAGGPYAAHLYLWGTSGIGYSPDMGASINDRRGNMGTLGIGSSQIVNICGG